MLGFPSTNTERRESDDNYEVNKYYQVVLPRRVAILLHAHLYGVKFFESLAQHIGYQVTSAEVVQEDGLLQVLIQRLQSNTPVRATVESSVQLELNSREVEAIGQYILTGRKGIYELDMDKRFPIPIHMIRAFLTLHQAFLEVGGQENTGMREVFETLENKFRNQDAPLK